MKRALGPKTTAIFGMWTPKCFHFRKDFYRHRELRRHLGGGSQTMLTRTLHSLESSGLITGARSHRSLLRSNIH
ncbi:MAG: winged helix-turn-helix transcriptional regulator [Acidobacteria bacterium]|nr:winged helix-turn-helix transcriptional regulator [Acidobacteriota bacterium]